MIVKPPLFYRLFLTFLSGKYLLSHLSACPELQH